MFKSSTKPSLPIPIFWGLVLLILGFSALPSLRLLTQIILSDDGWSSLSSLFEQKSTWKAFIHSLYTSFWAAIIALIIGSAFACIITLSNIRYKTFWIFLFMLPMMIPPQVIALSWLQLIGSHSALLKLLHLAPPLGSAQPLYSAEGIIALLGLQSAPLVFLTLRTNILAIPQDLIEIARLQGASFPTVLRTIIFPLCKNSLAAASAIAFISALGNFGIPAMLGIPISYYVLPTLIYQKMANFGHSIINEVASLSLLITLLALAIVGLQHYYQNKIQLMGLSNQKLQPSLGNYRLFIEIFLAIGLFLMVVFPLCALFVSSLVKAQGVSLNLETLSFMGYAQLFDLHSTMWRALKNSFALSISAALIILCLSLPLAYVLTHRSHPLLAWLKLIIDIPYAFPGTVLSIACILLFAKPIPFINILIYGSVWLILFAYISRFFTIGFKPIHSTMMQLDPSFEEAAQLCGASLWHRLRDIIFPLLMPSAFAGFILVFLIAFNELTVSALLWSAGNETIGVLIFNMEESGDSIQASALSMVVVFIIILLMITLHSMAKYLPKGIIPWKI